MASPSCDAGVAYGLAVWAGSYLGWLPAARLFPRVTAEGPRRVGLMIAAHVVWGATTDAVTAALLSRR